MLVFAITQTKIVGIGKSNKRSLKMKSQKNSSLSSLRQFFGPHPGIILASQYA